jgi:MiaB/RimO family radical SAM methylthiotransferase
MSVKIVTFGCRLNIYESEVIKNLLKNEFKDKEVIIFNTCAVTSEAEKQLKQSIRSYRKANPKAIIIAVGCAVDVNRAKYEKMQEIDFVLGNNEKKDLLKYKKNNELKEEKYKFVPELVKGMIVNRINRFIINVEIDNKIYECFCPCTGRIGNIILENIPCLLQKSDNNNRKTQYTIEAISLNKGINWIGINQSEANRYIEFLFKTNQLKDIINFDGSIDREKKIGNSRIDFIVGDSCVEVKTPLVFLFPQKHYIDNDILCKKNSKFVSIDRFIKHLKDLSNSLKEHKRAILLMVFIYEAERFKPPDENTDISVNIKKNVEESILKGLEIWQINLKIDESCVELKDYYNINNELFRKKGRINNNDNFISNEFISGFENYTRGFIQIQNGCDNQCTFCVTRVARGNSISMEPSWIIKQINKLKDYKEITLTGINIADYGKGLKEKINLGLLIKKILKETDLARIRLSSINLDAINDDLKDILFNEFRVMPHIHLSLQSGDDFILKKMLRGHTRQQAVNFCDEIKKYRKNIGIGADFIAGFPMESDDMHKNSYNLIKECGIVFGHIFPYSIRENTLAAKMEQVEILTRRERAKELRELCQEQLEIFTEQQLKLPQKILIENDKYGRTENYLLVRLDKIELNKRLDKKMKIGDIININS